MYRLMIHFLGRNGLSVKMLEPLGQLGNAQLKKRLQRWFIFPLSQYVPHCNFLQPQQRVAAEHLQGLHTGRQQQSLGCPCPFSTDYNINSWDQGAAGCKTTCTRSVPLKSFTYGGKYFNF